MRRRQAVGWLGLAGLGTFCLSASILRAADLIASLPDHSLWSICCRLAEGLFRAQSGAWLRAGVLGVGMLLVAHAAWNLTVRFVRSRRFASQLLELDGASTWRFDAHLDELGLQGRVCVVDLRYPSAFCYGFLRPRICLSAELVRVMSPSQMRAILLHERYHMRRRHPLISLALETLAGTLFFLPLIRELCDLVVAQMELKADRAAIQGAGRNSLAGALHRLLTRNEPPTPQPSPILNPLNATQARIDGILDSKPLRWRPTLPALATTVGSMSMICLLFMRSVG